MAVESARRVLVHVGARKTGSTAIQQFGATNRDWLAARGVHYVRAGGDPNHWRVFYSAHDLDDELAAEAKALGSEIHTVVVSAEALFTGSPRALVRCGRALHEAFGRDAAIDVVAYVRNPIAHAQSLLLQHVQGGELLPGTILELNRPLSEIAPTLLGDVLAGATIDFAAQLDRLQKYLVEGRLDVRLYRRDRFPGHDIVRDFLSCLDLDLDDQAGSADAAARPDDDATNPSLSLEGAAVLHRYFPDFVDSPERDALVRAALAWQADDRSRVFLRPATALVVGCHRAESHRALLDHYPHLDGLLEAEDDFGQPLDQTKVARCHEFVLEYLVSHPET